MRPVLSFAAVLGLAALAGAQDPKAPAPRRLLFIQASGYLYVNPLAAPPDGAGPPRAAEQFAAALRVPVAKGNNQLFVLTDTSAASPHPTRAAVVSVLDSFCATTREQDRAVIVFSGHAIERAGGAFFVPLDGDPDAPATLVTVADVYARLDKLKAAQKVVIWDVCRHNPDRVRGRRDGGPMSEGLFKALTAVPPGVQVLVSCSPGERGLEYVPTRLQTGSAYLDALRLTAADEFARLGAADLIPVDAWNQGAAKTLVAAAVATGLRGAKQTPVAVGAAPKAPAPFDPKAAPARRFDLPEPPKAPAADVKAVLDELALPPLFEADRSQVGAVPFAPDALKGAAPDVSVEEVLKAAEKYPLRAAVLRSLQAVREVWPRGGKEAKGVTPLAAPVAERTKKAISDAQQLLAEAVLRLEAELEALRAVEGHRAKETRRWQAHYDLTLAEVRLRLVVLNEYNLLLARVRTETLPDLPPGAPGWRLTAGDKLTSRKEMKDLLAAAQEGFEKVAADHKGTPWEVLARRSRATVPGLRWEPLPAPKTTDQ
ncbi:hypothetical protein GobsT_07980 [Gemmata obscuriglobus]|uniref:Peptidase C14 caspase domain-containing protein n=1 Tax=Gemmata obscuriglobus TaxID=114 RepID=A0A2Z3H758_9BACT|nr:caspase family protein [Gemmata obscuriglobus]AWM40671.1 hypothetical protein C1280_29265 [Gemmata obscuriglobus]QEG26063.1 hypothetical protein GobsT_07980 [Gemmata obscuriglobus]VTS00472.1 Uncharacterized protein OS=Isosphaera pallida (strain ATCC 43644 / DSM 9630 / IS1B) GN=Isop_0035 PE=4 SV=1 [Gemmata obscuriglobus UQM 2246]